MKSLILCLGIGFGLFGILWGTLWMMMCLDYKEQVDICKNNFEKQWEVYYEQN